MACAGQMFGDTLTVDYPTSDCGRIKKGISVQFPEQLGGWVIAFEDFERAYFAVRAHREAHGLLVRELSAPSQEGSAEK